ncbi:MAG: hypothetical protein HN995_14295 [Candidatus Marinimicrobia bacterium]|jgi:membrane-associated phospholipid phosphatase|nr:hypothetical protein [Candidatus Neomarinimicrobiota bacterium]MBT3575494.1 hypothetical protein [Candidatus Neomarinimicrobiota bacterium]MBT3679591.1 hypothetical protein [Candidatus Neomarinimicrobiota bacterium]MBT3950548.1 hypothetical protein [Candidatus Neomarinimicrobiota bacterium]MBT4253465.1 hypothetical protein [Candidatus Neomarinimicrobiota bacterium]
MKKHTLFANTLLQTLRIEELIGIVLITFTIIFASYANLYLMMNGSNASQNVAVNFLRIFTSGLLTFLFCRSILYHTSNKVFQFVRDFLPVLFVLIIYYNLQDAIFILNPRDIHHTLINLDGKLFGIQPTVWAERFYHPRLTDWFSFTYLNYYFMTLILLGLLYLKQRYDDFRVIVATIMIGYFIGFISYIIFPASSPFLVIPEAYEVDIWKDTSFFSWLTYTIVDLSPHRVRDAFPSMHNAIVLLTLILAWRYHRTYFWIQLPLAISLPFATVYLRYHYVVDIIGAIPVIALALYLTPRLVLRWRQFQDKNTSLEDNLGESGVNF